jgi:lysozyme
MSFDRKTFFDRIRPMFGGKLSQAQVDELNAILDASEGKEPKKMSISQRGIDFIKSFEKEVLTVYNDGYGFPTVGIGHLVKPEDKLKYGDKITKARSDAFFARDLATHAEPVNRLVRVPLTQGQYDSLTSLVFNIGEGNFAKSTLLRKLNDGDYAGARVAFASWNKSNGKVSNGLIRRRKEEQKMWDED